MSGRHPPFVTILASMLVVSGVAAARDDGTQDGTSASRIDRAEERIAGLLGAMENEQLPVAGRSMALDEVVELRAGMITGAPDDPRLPSWHADQAEDLLLKRIEFPNSWSTHLLNAAPGCHIMPEEIPLIIARGIEEAGAAVRTATAAVELLERMPAAGRNERLLGQLKFERDVRGPLLESIGLVLASPIDRTAADGAFETLVRLSREHAEEPAVARIIRHWLTIAAIESGRLDEIDDVPAEVDTLDELDLIRAAIRTRSAAEAAARAATVYASTSVADRHRRLLAADLHERALDGVGMEGAWSDGRGRLWIALLEDESGRTDRSYDDVLASRLSDLVARLGEDGMPIGAAWALGERELVSRSEGGIADQRVATRLDLLLDVADRGTPGRARALGVRARLAIADSDRLAAARALERLYLDHPDAPESDPCLVADLLQPALGLGVPWVGPSYRRALQACIASDPEGPDADRLRASRQLELAEHDLENERADEALETLAGIRTGSAVIGARTLELRSRAVRTLADAGGIDPDSARSLHRGIADDHARLVDRFGSVNPELRAAGATTRIAAALTELRDGGGTTEDLADLREIASDEALDASIRIRALLLRHELRSSRDVDGDALRLGPDLIEGLRIDATSARDLMIENGRARLDEIEMLRDLGETVDPGHPLRRALEPYAFALDSGIPPGANIIDRIALARILFEGGRSRSALAIWDGIAEEHPNTLEVMVGRADVLSTFENLDSMGEAISTYRILGRGRPGDLVPDAIWWHAQLRQLLILEQVARSIDRIAPRIERLRLVDPELGGSRHRAAFEALQERVRSRADG